MKVIVHSRELIALKRELVDRPLALIPTMGALHAGHLKLAEEAQSHGYYALVSIFINPRQFNNPSDLAKYPRTEKADIEKLENAGIDAVYLPTYDDVYSEDIQDISLNIGSLADVYEGHFRPGHFDGVIQVLHRFFTKVQPDAVFFGEKDLQQCMVVKKLLLANFSQIKYFQIPTIRESSGLAMSSRNQRLTPNGLQIAANIYQQLLALKQACISHDFLPVEAKKQLLELGIETEYLDWVGLPDMNAITKENSAQFRQQALVFAGYLEGVRLIDNLVFSLDN